MNLQIGFKLNENLYIKDPEGSVLGKSIVKNAIDLIYELGFEHFTFKKLATRIQTNEPSIYRYFENKHALLLYILNWYWSYMHFLLTFKLNNLKNKEEKIKTILKLLTQELPASKGVLEYNHRYLNQIVIMEGSKTYFIKEVDKMNEENLYSIYKEFCALIADEIKAYNPHYPYPHSLSSTLIEAAHQQQFFAAHLPRLTDYKDKKTNLYTQKFLENLVFNVLNKK
jgi:AcrR family transcriptional regulator